MIPLRFNPEAHLWVNPYFFAFESRDQSEIFFDGWAKWKVRSISSGQRAKFIWPALTRALLDIDFGNENLTMLRIYCPLIRKYWRNKHQKILWYVAFKFCRTLNAFFLFIVQNKFFHRSNSMDFPIILSNWTIRQNVKKSLFPCASLLAITTQAWNFRLFITEIKRFHKIYFQKLLSRIYIMCWMYRGNILQRASFSPIDQSRSVLALLVLLRDNFSYIQLWT